eukprot:gnl/Hemi2/15515_TR5220_c0_g1_i1.p1 gnl/Hemi2/15515_TR5220_c0_g1~~gnl/Hemi2/15515_TR5220_c0_g1_i1.p1  ORF type:complete len:359 (-),score=56.12 gnl/Hemi2/15515_TR5220_c0_g1_i1:270-1346(-)
MASSVGSGVGHLRVLLHHTEAGRVVAPAVINVYQGEVISEALLGAATVVVTQDGAGAVSDVAFVGDGQVHSFQTTDDATSSSPVTTLHVSAAWPVPTSESGSAQGLKSVADLYKEFSMRNDYLRTLVFGAVAEGLFTLTADPIPSHAPSHQHHLHRYAHQHPSNPPSSAGHQQASSHQLPPQIPHPHSRVNPLASPRAVRHEPPQPWVGDMMSEIERTSSPAAHASRITTSPYRGGGVGAGNRRGDPNDAYATLLGLPGMVAVRSPSPAVAPFSAATQQQLPDFSNQQAQFKQQMENIVKTAVDSLRAQLEDLASAHLHSVSGQAAAAQTHSMASAAASAAAAAAVAAATGAAPQARR